MMKQLQTPYLRRSAFKWFGISLIAGLLTVSCVYDFTPENPGGTKDILVIEGDILAGENSNFRISTTVALSAPEKQNYITKATVWVESEEGEIINAAYDGNTSGFFTANTTHIDFQKKYKLCVDIPGRGSYRSSFIPVLQSPQIDSITYTIGDNREYVRMEVSTHSDQPENKYYKWLYQEDWEFNVDFIPTLQYNKDKNDLENIPSKEMGMQYYCWEKDSSTDIYIASSEKLSKNVIYKQPLNTIYPSDRRISLLYSLQVSQIALTKEGYIYWETLKKNTDETGGIFAPQPSEMRGNLESLTNPGEAVIGFISASTITQKRIFISREELRVYKKPSTCRLDTLARKDWILAAEHGTNEVVEELPQIGKAVWVVARCANCVKAGGTKNKPSFWPNAHR